MQRITKTYEDGTISTEIRSDKGKLLIGIQADNPKTTKVASEKKEKLDRILPEQVNKLSLKHKE